MNPKIMLEFPRGHSYYKSCLYIKDIVVVLRQIMAHIVDWVFPSLSINHKHKIGCFVRERQVHM